MDGVIMKYTSAQAGKLLKKLNDDLNAVLKREQISKEFIVSAGEDVESIRPDYDFMKTQGEIETIQGKIRKVKHALNVFNSTTVIPEFNVTIDEMLILIPQLSKHKERLQNMKDLLPKMRLSGGYSRPSSIVEYRYLNYEVKKAQEEYDRVSEILAKAQTALDVINNSMTFDVEI